MLVHTYIEVNEDEMKKVGWKGSLIDFAAEKMNEWQDRMLPAARIINVESSCWTNEIRPLQCNSSTWYKRRSIGLTVWMDSDIPIPKKVKLTELGRKFIAKLAETDEEVKPFLKKDFLWKRGNPSPEGQVWIAMEPTSRGALMPEKYVEDYE